MLFPYLACSIISVLMFLYFALAIFECSLAIEVQIRSNHYKIFIYYYHSTLNHNEHESEKESEREEVKDCRAGMSALEKMLEDQKREREKVEQEKERVVQDYERSQMERAQERGKHVRLWLMA